MYGIGTALLYALVTGKLTPHGCSSERLSEYVFVSACACVLCRLYVYHLDHKRLRYLLDCRSLLDGGFVPSKTSMRICICTLTRPHPTPHTTQTDRALLIEWPGAREGMRQLVQPGPRCTNWRIPSPRSFDSSYALTGG
jgi:hypothetical protein